MEQFIAVIHRFVSFTYPFGWEELGVVATTAAVVVALWANHSAKKQLNAALAMQEQSKNVSLLDKRVEVADNIRNDREISITALKVLFNPEIEKKYSEIIEWQKKVNDAANDEWTYFEAVKTSDGEGGFLTGVRDKIAEYEMYLSRPDCPENIEESFRQYCKEKEIFYSATGFSDDRKTYNYCEITERKQNATKKVNEIKQTLLKLIEAFIADSIKSI